MTRALATASVLVAICASSACHKTGSNAGKDLTNPGQSAPVNTAQDVAAAQVGMASASTVGGFTTDGYVKGAAIGDMYEIEAGKIAADRSKSSEVKALAKMMIADHTKMTEELKATLKSAGIALTPPTDLDQRRKGMIDNLHAAGDSDFDLAYLHQQLAGHLETLTMMKGFQNHGDNDALKKLAGQSAPIVEKHLAEIRHVGGDKLKAVAPGQGGNAVT